MTPALPNRRQQCAVARQDAQRVVADGGPRPEQDQGHALVGDGVDPGLEVGGLGSAEAQGTVLHRELTAGEPQQAVAVGLGDARFGQAQASGEEAGHQTGLSSNMP